MRLAVIVGAAALLAGCGGGAAPTSSSTTTTPAPPTSTTANTVSVVVNAGPDNIEAANELFVSVTICVPGTSDCQTIPDVVVDTGAEGFRVLSSELSLSLPQETSSGGAPLGNCIAFADNSYMWGPVVTADIEMGGEKASSVPIQVVGDPNFPGVPSSCNTGGQSDDTVAAMGGYATIGVGVFQQDCGPACAGPISEVPDDYYSCPSTGCSLASASLSDQLQNPVWMFPTDNNGVMITLPSVPGTGSATVTGSMNFGIGTQSDNALGSTQIYTTDDEGNFSTTFNGAAYSNSYIDTGSNGFFFLSPTVLGIPNCSDAPGFYCPTATQNYTATNTGANGLSGQVSFSIANADALFDTGDAAFNDLGGSNAGSFDWGLPFFFGRTVYVAIQNQNTPAGEGPFWAY
ncbi:MAG: DUF3443 domain-containing protein [Terriglobia bacterium]